MLKRQRICQLGTKNRQFKIYLMKTRVIILHSFASQVNVSYFMDIQHTGFYMTLCAAKSDIGHEKNNKEVC